MKTCKSCAEVCFDGNRYGCPQLVEASIQSNAPVVTFTAKIMYATPGPMGYTPKANCIEVDGERGSGDCEYRDQCSWQETADVWGADAADNEGLTND